MNSPSRSNDWLTRTLNDRGNWNTSGLAAVSFHDLIARQVSSSTWTTRLDKYSILSMESTITKPLFFNRKPALHRPLFLVNSSELCLHTAPAPSSPYTTHLTSSYIIFLLLVKSSSQCPILINSAWIIGPCRCMICWKICCYNVKDFNWCFWIMCWSWVRATRGIGLLFPPLVLFFFQWRGGYVTVYLDFCTKSKDKTGLDWPRRDLRAYSELMTWWRGENDVTLKFWNLWRILWCHWWRLNLKVRWLWNLERHGCRSFHLYQNMIWAFG